MEMGHAEQKVNDLLSEDTEMDDALSTVLVRAEENGGTVEWADVKNDLTSGQWGRIIEKGVLQSASGNGFSVRNPEELRGALNGDSSTTVASDTEDDEDEGSSWTTYDKLAGLASLGMMAGYAIGPVKDTVGGIMDILLGPLDAMIPFYAVILLLAVATGLYSSLLQANLMNTDKMQEQQKKMQDIKERREAAKERGDDEAIERIQQEQMEAMGDQMGAMKEQFRPMVWVMLLTIPVFLWMYWMVETGGIGPGEMRMVMPFIGDVKLTETVGPTWIWLIWYFLCSMGFTQVTRKALNIQTSPSSS